jgi:murein DD-endopeptidase MepM/ murein hydrolase activator NlpD
MSESPDARDGRSDQRGARWWANRTTLVLLWVLFLPVSRAYADSLVLNARPPGEAGPQVDAAVISPDVRAVFGAAPAWRTYVVQPGDTLSAIALRSNLDAGTLALRNGLADPNRLQVGQVLRMDTARAVRMALPANGDLARLQIWPWPPTQGQTLVVWLRANRPVTFTLSLADQTYPVVTSEGWSGWGLIPISSLAMPGDQPLRVTAGRTSLILPMAIRAGVFESYDVPASASVPILSQASKVQAELERTTELFSRETPGGWTPHDRFRSPLEGDHPHTSPFGSRRTYGGGSSVSAHAGEDMSAPPGTPVLAPAAGLVVLAEPLFVRGNAVILDHGHGVLSGYWHLSKLHVSLGDQVKPGQLLGEVGSTGLSTGAHLHWELRIDGIAVDPLQWLQP